MLETRQDFEKSFHVDPFDQESHVDPTRRCAKGPLSWRLGCLVMLVQAEPSSVKLGPFLVTGRITSALAKSFDVQAQIARVQAVIQEQAIEEQASREASEQKAERIRLCNAGLDEANTAVERWRGDVAKVHEVWEKTKPLCGDLWSPVQQQRMDNMIQEATDQAQRMTGGAKADENAQPKVDRREGGGAHTLPTSRTKSLPRHDQEERALRDRLLSP